MAMSTSKRLLLIAFVLLCFISLTAKGRTLRESTTGNINNNGEDEKGYKSNMLKTSKAGGEKTADNNTTTDGDFVTMDYTPAKKNPPIHN
ncbi:hypothetical protein QN277_025950 [Acacia crassicarpa]|uniref:Uncharacterized protein n=1 Tax=Acacia crassicarpa TaxID=499986 RepID=A0AAE1JB04_9FABA|nr:hypothetical protein QN277_025950 [Acacia crassicarpa]